MSGDIVLLIGIIFGAYFASTGLLYPKSILIRVSVPILLFLFSLLFVHFILYATEYLELAVFLYGIAFCIGYLIGLLLVYLLRYFLFRRKNKS